MNIILCIILIANGGENFMFSDDFLGYASHQEEVEKAIENALETLWAMNDSDDDEDITINFHLSSRQKRLFTDDDLAYIESEIRRRF